MERKLRVAVVGLGFGAEFVPIYQAHPNVESVAICDPATDVLHTVGVRYGIAERFTDLRDVLRADIDAVHLVTPIPLHAGQTVAVLDAGKHCACTVPMALSIGDLRRVVAAQRRAARNFMMMETAVYTREFLFVKHLAEAGELGPLQFLRGAHFQDMENWPDYWMGLPPMYYATHAIAPLLVLAGARARRVHCFGSGTMRPELRVPYGNPYPVETAGFQLEGSSAAAEVTRTLFHTAREYMESFSVYGEQRSFEWQQLEAEEPVLFTMGPTESSRGRPIRTERVNVPDRTDLLPPELARFTRQSVYNADQPHRSVLQGGGHGGSHPHLVHEFVRSIVENRPPVIDAVTAADWTAAGICAHQSAMAGGEAVDIPCFDQRT
ncbi:MAG: Gfo/Idh/MocA family protein [Chloroflexota bacterium]